MFCALSEDARGKKQSPVGVNGESRGEGADRTRSDADHHSQALGPSAHDDGGQDLPPEQAVLDASGEGVEALVAQHGQLVVQGAAADGELQPGHEPRLTRDDEQGTGQKGSTARQEGRDAKREPDAAQFWG